jgi:creatinase
MTTERPAHYRFANGDKAPLPFSPSEYETRLAGLRATMAEQGIAAAVLTSMHNVAYYSGFLYCSFGRPYGLVVTSDACVTISAGIDGGQPWRRSFGDSLTYTDWTRDNFWRAVAHVAGTGRVVGVEADHLTLAASEKFNQAS